MTYNKMLRNSTDQLALDEKGVVQVDFAPPELIDQIREQFDKLHPVWNETMKSGYYFSIDGDGMAYRKAIFDSLYPLLKEPIDKLFSGYKILAIMAQVKGVGDHSAVNIHQDLTMVDESKFRSYTLWVPLQDSTYENGPLSFLESSHIGLRNFRGHTIEYLFDDAEEFIQENSKTFLAAKGEALIFDVATLHYSNENRSSRPRISIGISIVDEKAETELLHYDKLKPFDGSVDRYAVPADFWHRYDDFTMERLLPPSFGTKIGRRSGVRVLPYSKQEFEELHRSGCEEADRIRFNATVVPVVKDPSIQKELNDSGFVVADLLSPTEVQQLKDLFAEMNQGRNDIPLDRLYTCLHNPDPDYRNRMEQEIGKVLNPHVARFFKDVKHTVYTFQIKGIGPDSELYAHQDWTFTHEHKGLRNYTLWISLIDSDETNGTLSVLPGSHLKLNNIRGAGIEPIFSGKQQEAIPFLTPLSIKAGQLVLFDSALLHYSSANHSNSIRVSVMTNIMPLDADVFLYFQNIESAELVDEYQVPDDFFLYYKDFKSEYEKPPAFGTFVKTTRNKRPHLELFKHQTSLSGPATNWKDG